MFVFVEFASFFVIAALLALILVIGVFESHFFGLLATAVAGFFLMSVDYGLGIDLWGMIKQEPLIIGVFAILYFAAGSVYSLFRWNFYLNSDWVQEKIKKGFAVLKKETLDAVKWKNDRAIAEYKREKHLYNQDEIPQEVLETITEKTPTDAELLEKFKASDYNPVRPSKHKATILLWLVWWVPSAIWWAIGDMTREIATFVYNRLSSIFERLSLSKIDKVLK